MSTKSISTQKTTRLAFLLPRAAALPLLGGATKKTVVLVLEPSTGYTVGTSGKVKLSILAGQGLSSGASVTLWTGRENAASAPVTARSLSAGSKSGEHMMAW